MGFMNCGNEILGVQQKIATPPNVGRTDGVHVVNENAAKYLMTRNPKVAATISGNDDVPNPFPFRRTVKSLVHVPVKAKGFLAHITAQPKITISLFKGRKLNQL